MEVIKEKTVCGVKMYSVDGLMDVLGIRTRAAISRWVKRNGLKGTWITVEISEGKFHHKKFYPRQQIVEVMTGARHG